jgi:hypothetical protein
MLSVICESVIEKFVNMAEEIAQQGGINEEIMTILKDEHTSFIKAIFWHISSQSSENKLNNRLEFPFNIS